MQRAVVILIMAVVLAGCTRAPGADPEPSSSGGAFVTVDLGVGGPEPVVAFSPEGAHLYIAAQDAQGKGPRVWVSDDGGASFVLHRPTSEGGGEVDLAAGPGGAVYLTQLGVRGNLVSVSTDYGETWQTAPLGGASQYFDREWLAVDAQGRAYVVAREFGQTASAGVARSDDRGLTFPPRGKPWTALDEPGDANGNLAAVDDAIHLIYVCRGAAAICLATSRDGGVVWTQHVIAERGVGVANVYPALAATSRGLVATWSDATDGALAVYAATSVDGATWSAPRKVSVPGGTATLPWVAARSDVLWVVYLRAEPTLAATDCSAAADATWFPHARRLALDATPLGDAIALTAKPVHDGVISPPVGQSCGSAGGRDRLFGDFFTATVSRGGKLVVAISTDDGRLETTRDIVIRER